MYICVLRDVKFYMKKAILSIICLVFSGIVLMAQQNEFGFSKDKMNGHFIQQVKEDNGKMIYAVDLSTLNADKVAVFMEKLSSESKVYPVSVVGKDGLLFIAGFTSVVTEEQVKAIVENLKTQAFEGTSSPQAKQKVAESNK